MNAGADSLTYEFRHVQPASQIGFHPSTLQAVAVLLPPNTIALLRLDQSLCLSSLLSGSSLRTVNFAGIISTRKDWRKNVGMTAVALPRELSDDCRCCPGRQPAVLGITRDYS